MQDNKKIKYALYCRKSTDDERQVLSLDSQKSEALKRFNDLDISFLPDEAVSAFKPYKRSVFNQLIERIKAGKIQGIVAWHPDRLSRNPIDAAQIIYLLDLGLLKDLKFCSYNFDNSPEGKMMLQIVMSQSKYSSDKLSKDVKRGIDKKASMGWRSGKAPLGFLNTKTGIRGEQEIHKDPETFDLVRRLFEKMLTGNYTGPALLQYVNDTLGLRMPANKKFSMRKLRTSGLYRILTNPFYYGWFEWPIRSGNWMPGKHKPMISEAQFDRIQFLLGRKGRPRPKTHKFAYTGLIKCPCGAAITAEEKFKKQKNGKVHQYIYYHCTRKIDPSCTQKSVEVKELEKQIETVLSSLSISEKFQKWALKYLHEVRSGEAQTREQIIATKTKAYEKTTKQIDGLVLAYTSPQNAQNQIMSEEEYLGIRSRLLKDKNELFADLNVQDKETENWIELSERTFNFARYARAWFINGDIETKKAIFSSLGSDLLLEDRKVAINMRKPFNFIFEGLSNAKNELERLEPLESVEIANRIDTFSQQFPLLSG